MEKKNSEIISINIFGDFFTPNVGNLQFGNALKNILEYGDINVVNMEAPITVTGARPIRKSGPNICQDPNVPAFLEHHGFNVISLANNHIMDYGQEAATRTVNSFKNAICVGVGSIEEAYSVKYVTVRNTRIGFISITQYEFGVHAENYHEIGAAWMCHPKVDEKIIQAKKDCDYLIVLPHAGLEYFMLPLPELRTLYRHFIDMGANAVIASHPHVPQPWETYKGKPIAYSLGNFCFDKQSNSDFWYEGLCAQLIIDNADPKMEILELNFDSHDKFVEIIPVCSEVIKYKDVFSNEAEYINAVNEKCKSLKGHYNMLFEMSGYYRLSIKKSLGYLKRKLLKKESQYNDSHFINNMRNETHRWVLSRIYELENK